MANPTIANLSATLIAHASVYNKTSARVNGTDLGADAFGLWKSAEMKAYQAFYNYKKAKKDSISGATVNLDPIRTEAMNALQVVLDAIGDINGHRLPKDRDMLEELAGLTVRAKTDLAGRALTLNSEVRNLKAELRNINDGVDPEWLESKTTQLIARQEALRLEKKCVNSGTPVDTRVKFETFRADFEREIAKLALGQSMKTWEELEAEAEAKRQARRAHEKARKAAKKAAEAKANA